MSIPKQHYSADEIGRLGQDIYDRQIRPLVEPEHRGEVVAIDVESGDYALGEDPLQASKHLHQRRPDAQIWFMRVGERGVYRIRRPSREERE